MTNFDVQGVELSVPHARAHAFIADPAKLPRWTRAFASVTPGRAVMRAPTGEVEIMLSVHASQVHGTVDWHMTFPDGSVASAFSRVVPIAKDRCAYSFVLLAPPVPLEEIEGALAAQSRTLTGELETLKRILEHDA